MQAQIVGLWLSLAVSGLLGQSTDHTEPPGSQRSVRHTPSLCAGEQQFVDLRKQVVLEALRGLDINCTLDSVPHVALLGSGGGQRAAVGLMGALSQMGKDGLLDSLLYLGGVSGSTWSMASLYSDPEWSSNMDRAESKLTGHAVPLGDALQWLNKTEDKQDFSLSDVWGLLTSAGIMKQMEKRHLSEEASRNASNPYPVYSALEKNCYSVGPIEGKWFELSPHEAGFTELDLFVNTSLLGSRFQEGQLLETVPEMDMVQLQGICGSALAHGQVFLDLMPSWIQGAERLRAAAPEFLRVYHALLQLIHLTGRTVPDASALSRLAQLQTAIREKVNQNESALLDSKSEEELTGHFRQRSEDLLSTVSSWLEALEEEPFKSQVSVLLKRVLPLVLRWEWGTTGNFLYQYQDPSVPECLSLRDRVQLVDAGLLINAGYPPFLGDKRDIDLIIAPEFSAGDLFETLTLARDYAAQVKKPFPAVDPSVLEDIHWPRDCYVFQGTEHQPTIVYMPLFNRRNCKDAEEYKAKMEEFSTFQGPYSEDMMASLLETAKRNMENNRDTLVRELRKAAERRGNKRLRGTGTAAEVKGQGDEE